jgi:cobalt transporter subunit CbtA
MGTFRSIVFSSVIAGFVVGVLVTLIQQFSTVPLILKAEVFEKAAEARHGGPAAAGPQETAAGHDHSDHQHSDHEHADHDHAAAAWEPSDGLERNAYTAAANVLTAIGFALVLAGFFAMRSGATGENVSWQESWQESWYEGLMWGLAGFAVFTIAPGLGLPPELPGVPAAPLVSRQIWWVVAALATATGLALIVFRRSVPAAIAGLLLIMLPHFIGAPELEHVETDVPSSLSHQFVVAVTLTSLVFWSMLGALTSAMFAYFERDALERRQLHA